MPGTQWNIGLLTAVFGLVDDPRNCRFGIGPRDGGGAPVPAGRHESFPPGTPPLPPCPKAGAGKPVRLSVDGSRRGFTGEAGPWGHCTPAQGGGSHTDASPG